MSAIHKQGQEAKRHVGLRDGPAWFGHSPGHLYRTDGVTLAKLTFHLRYLHLQNRIMHIQAAMRLTMNIGKLVTVSYILQWKE